MAPAKKPASKAAAPKPATGKPKAPKATAGDDTAVSKPPRMSLLAAAAAELGAAETPLSCREIVQAILANGTWTTSGKTPSATLSAALHREIKVRGAESRFAKAGRGRFELRQAVTS